MSASAKMNTPSKCLHNIAEKANLQQPHQVFFSAIL
jgi:hypothetical protein